MLALDRGADDCVSGDISDAELAARLRVQQRRVAAEAARWIRCGPLAYDQRDRTAVLGQEPLRLSQQELTLLEALIRRPGRFIAAQVLLNGLLRQRESLSLNAVQVQICRLRQKLRHSAVRIATLRGQGYCLEVEGGERNR
ncbi:MAG: response regulator transcription factor [Burkholderiaceae bacterium]|nr:response regulator transcription factor [Burkholderiaceae bacterium]